MCTRIDDCVDQCLNSGVCVDGVNRSIAFVQMDSATDMRRGCRRMSSPVKTEGNALNFNAYSCSCLKGLVATTALLTLTSALVSLVETVRRVSIPPMWMQVFLLMRTDVLVGASQADCATTSTGCHHMQTGAIDLL